METVVGLIASAVFLVRLLPQPLRLARTGVPAGVSPTAALNAVVSAVAWTWYGVAAGLPIVWVVSVLALGPSSWTAVLLRRSTRVRAVFGACCFAGVVVGAWAGGLLELVLGVSVMVTMGPQVVTALRSSDLRGIAPATMWIALLDAVTWGAYGLVIGDLALGMYAVVLTASAVTVLVRISVTSREMPVRA